MSLKSIVQLASIFKEIAVGSELATGSITIMDAALKSMSASQIAATVSASGLSAEQIKCALSATGMNEALILEKLSLMGFSKEAAIAAVVSDTFTKEQAEAAITAAELTFAEGTATVATNTFTLSIGAATKALITFLMTNPIGWIMGVVGVVFLAVKAFDAFTVSAEEATEQMEESVSAYEEATSKLESLNNELATAKDRIEELEAKDSLTFVEESELEKLRKSVELLQIQADLAEKERVRKAKDVADDTVTAYKKNFKHEISADSVNDYISSSSATGNNVGLLSDESNISAMLAAVEQFKRLRDELDKDSDYYAEDYQHFQEIIDETTDSIWNQVSVLSTYKENLEAIPYDELSDAQKQALDEINDAIELIYTSLDPSKWNDIQWNKILNKDQFKDDVKALKELASESELTVDVINKQFPALAQACKDAGLEIEDVVNNINASLEKTGETNGEGISRYKANLSELKDVISDLKSSYDVLETAQEEMAGGKGLSPDTIADLAEAEANYIDYLYEENGVIKLNTEAWKENANAKMQSEMAEIQKEIDSINEENAALEELIKTYEEKRLAALAEQDLTSYYDYYHLIDNTNAKIQENNEAIAKNQGLLATYGGIFASITGEMDVYTSALSNFTNIANTIDSVSGSLQTLADLQAQVANGFTMSLDKALEFAAVYPEILNNAQVAANGQITLNEDVVDSFIQGKEAELNAEVDAKIVELEAKKSVLEAQLAFSQAELDLAKEVGEGESQIAKEVAEFRLDTANKLVAALIEAGVDEATAFQLACAAMAGNAEEFDRIVMEVCTDVNGNFNQAAYEAAQAIYKNMNSAKRDVASLATQAQQTAEAIAGMADGVKKGSSAIVGGSGGGTLNSGIKLNLTGVDFKGTEYTYEAKEIGLEDFISDLELDISKYQNAIAQIDGQIAALQALKNRPLKSFKSGSGSGTDSSTKEIEEYTASIDDYREAIERLNRIQIKRTDLETKLSNTNDLRTQIELQKELIGVYKEEQNALHDLNELRDQTIKEGVESLQELGFNVEYDPDSNLFFVKNLEHLNELVADSAGEYGSLQEATNALRKDTETLINTLGNLNEANQENSKSWSELAQAAHEARIAIYENTRKESENQIKISENLLSHSLSHAQKVGMNFSVSVNDSELQELINVYKEEIATVESLGIDLNKTIYGNIDTNNRQILEWTEDNLNKYKDALASWDTTVDEMRGSFSTIFGSSSEYDGIEIAFSPILQTENGPVLLDSHTLDEYIYGLIDKAGEGWTSEKLLQLDTEGLEFDGQIIKNLLADIGDTAIQTGEAMHYVGDLGSISTTYKELEEAAVSAQMSVEDLNNAIANGSVQNIETSDIGYFYDISSIELHISDIISQYRKMQDTLLAEAEEYRRQGYADTSNEISELIDLWWDYYDKIAEVSAEAWGQVVDNANEALDRITGIFDTLKGAAKEFAESGYITVDTLQEICSWGIQYLAYLQDENGQLVINEGNIQNVIAARTEQMAVETALSYVAQIRSAIERNEINELMNLTLATEATTNATWDLVYAQLRLMNLSGELNDTMYAGALQNVNNLRSLTANVVENVGQMYTCTEEIEEDTSAITDALREQKELLEDQADAMDDLLKYVKEMIKQEVKNQIKALEDQVSEYKKIVNLQKESLKLEREKDNYNKNVKNKINDIADLQKRIAMLDLDGSREAQAEKVKLQEELAELQEDLADTQADHAYDATCNMLDDMADAYEEEKKKEIEILENSISSEEKLYQLAIERIQTQWDTLYQQLIDWNYEYGTVTNDEITSVWQSASAAVEKYGSYLDAVLATTREIAALEAQIEAYQSSRSSSHSSSGGGMSTSIPSTPSNPQTNNVVGNSGKYDTSGDTTISQVKSIVHQMKTNSEAHHSADTEGKARLNKTNLELGKQFTSITGRTAVRGDDGVWYLDRVGGPRLYETYPYSTYHTGGIVGDDPTLKQNEVFAKLKKGEAVLTEEQQKPIYKVLDFAETMINQFGGLFAKINATDMMNMRIQDNFNKNAQQIQNIVQTSSGNTFDINVPVEVHTVQKLDETEIRKLTKDISKYTITEINDSLAKKGLNSVKNPLRP